MRPLRLEFQAFGSYPGKQVVDFTVLAQRGLFVVTGPTGTGKTTVFDAMVYALYGALPGQRGADGDPRSHHASADVETYVALIFEVDGERYVVRRSPKQERPKVRGTGTTSQAADAHVAKIVGDGTESLATQMTKTTAECERLVGLDAKQFQRVVLLPQGKFTDFLIATDEDREKLLRQLFGGELFEQATSWLKRKVVDLDERVRDVDAEVQHHRSNADDALRTVRGAWLPDEEQVDPSELGDGALRDAIATLDPVRARREAERDRLLRVATQATTAAANALGLAQRHDAARDAAARLAELAAVEAELAAGEQTALASRRVRPVVVADDAIAAATVRAAATDLVIANLRAHVERAFEALDRPAPAFDAASIAAAVQSVGQDLEAQKVQLRAARSAAHEAQAADEVVAALRVEHDQLQGQVAALQGRVVDLTSTAASLEPVAAEVATRERAHGDAADRLERRRQLMAALDQLTAAQRADHTARGAYEDVMARFVATQAPRLAAELRPDEPCPVCGSTTHPSPAEPVGDDAVDHDAVDTARSTWTRASNKVATLDSVIAGLREALGADAESPIDAFQDLVAEADIALQHARAAVAELSTTRSDLADLAAALADADESALAKQHELATRSGAAESLRAEATRLVDVVADIDEAKVDANLAVHRTLDAALDGLADAFDGATATATVLAEATSRLADELVASGCADVAAARATLLDAAEEIRRIDRADQWRRDVAAQQARLHTLTEQGIPDERPDVDAADASASEANRVANAATEAFTTAANALRTAGSELDRAIAVSAGSAELRAERDDARVVFKTCNGEAGIRVKLERWVLAGELDRVTTAANDHLARMTNHRYTLQRSGAKGGLALEVFDAHTGRARPTASLSGGEQFQASLSLALGLADVVSHGGSASGRQFEALFVDEGFGSLDPNALDDAIRALAQLHAAGRMVGAITHVEAMKQQLHVGIEVSALADGRGSTLTVYP